MKPSFWADAKVAALPERTRLFYIGLWMLADDAGWLRWDPVEASRDLYGYEPRARRERRVVEMFGELQEVGRVVLHDCGHAQIPKLAEHQRLAGATKQVRTVEREHSACPAGPRAFPHVPARNGKERKGEPERDVSESNGSARAPEKGAGASEFRDRMAAAGAPLELVR